MSTQNIVDIVVIGIVLVVMATTHLRFRRRPVIPPAELPSVIRRRLQLVRRLDRGVGLILALAIAAGLTDSTRYGGWAWNIFTLMCWIAVGAGTIAIDYFRRADEI